MATTAMADASPISNLPLELLEKVFLYVISSPSALRFRAYWKCMTLVNHTWSEVAFRMEFVRIHLENDAQTDRLLERIEVVRARGHPRAPTRYLETNPQQGETICNLKSFLNYAGHSIEDLKINGGQSDDALPVPFVEAALSNSLDPGAKPIHLPVLRRLRCTQIHISDFLVLLNASSTTLESLKVLHSGIISSQQVSSYLGELVLPVLLALSLHDGAIPRPLPVGILNFFFKAAPQLEDLHLSIRKSELPRAITWLREECPHTLKQLTLWVRVLRRSFDASDAVFQELYSLLDERAIKGNVIAYLGRTSWTI